MDDAELKFPFNEASEFIDMEEGESYITSPASIRKAYLENLNEFLSYCRKKCQSSGVDYCLLNTAMPLDEALSSYMAKRSKKFLMVFLSPLFLIGLLAAAIPIIFTLSVVKNHQKLCLAPSRFLKKTSKKLVLFQHLQQILLLLLRSLVIVLLVLAFARPLIDRSIARLLDVDPQSAVVLIDLSMSMQYGETFERAKTEALDIISSMTSGDEVALIGFSDGAQLVSDFNSDLDSVRSTINEISAAGFGRTRYLPNLRLADQMLEGVTFRKSRCIPHIRLSGGGY